MNDGRRGDPLPSLTGMRLDVREQGIGQRTEVGTRVADATAGVTASQDCCHVLHSQRREAQEEGRTTARSTADSGVCRVRLPVET